MRRPYLIRRNVWKDIPSSDVMTHGCLPVDEIAEECYDEMMSEAWEFNTVWEKGDMPVLKFNDAFIEWRAFEMGAMDALRENGYCTLPWEVLKHIGGKTLYYSQKNLPSCMGHADTFAWHSTLLTEIGRGSPLVYSPLNALFTWCWTKGGSTRGGQTVSVMAEGANRIGHFPIELVGDNNLSYNATKAKAEQSEAAKYQSAIMFLPFKGNELADQIIKTCRAGLSVAFGNSTAVSGSTKDSNGVKVAVIRGSWAHATHFTGYREVNGIPYIFWVNSHGSIYGVSDEGEPADGCWMTRKQVEQMASTMSQYGAPYLVIPESRWIKYDSIVPAAKIPFPANFRM